MFRRDCTRLRADDWRAGHKVRYAALVPWNFQGD